MYWNDLDLNSKSKLMELYLKNGITSLTAMKEHYNSLQDGGRLTFKQWKEKMQQKYPDIEMDNNKAGYDYETYFNDNYNEAIAQLNNLRHFPDTYKLYNHPTFSNESIYSRGPMIGGSWGYAHPWDTQWSNTEGFTPSIVNIQVHPEIYKEDRPYTENEIYSHRFGPGGPITKIIKDAAQKVITARQNVNSNSNKVDLSVPITQGYGTTSESSSTNVNRTPVQQIELAPKGWTAERIELANAARQYERNRTTPQLRASDIPAPRNQEEAEAYERARAWRVEQQRRLEEDAKVAQRADQAAETIASMLPYSIPYLGQALAVKDMSDALYEGNTEEAALMAVLSTWPFISKAVKGGMGLVGDAANTVQNTNFARSVALARNFNKNIRGTTLTTSPIENIAHNRFRLGDVEINDPNLMYRQTDGRALGEVASGGNRHTMFNRGSLWYGIPTESMLNPVIEPKTVGKLKLTKPNSEVAKTHLLVTRNADMTGANQKFGRVSIGPHSESSLHLNIEKSPEDRWLNEMIREWRNKNSEPGIATYITDGGSRRVPLEGALNNSNTSIYTFDSGYGYRKIGETIPTLEEASNKGFVFQQNNPLVLGRSVSPESLNSMLRFNYMEGSPSLGMMQYNAPTLGKLEEMYANGEGITFLFDRDILSQPHLSFLGDADTPIKQKAAQILGKKLSEVSNITPQEVVKGKRLLMQDSPHKPISDAELIYNTRNGKYLRDDEFYNEVLLDDILDYRKAKGAVINTDNPDFENMLIKLGIPYDNTFSSLMNKISFKGFSKGGKLNGRQN